FSLQRRGSKELHGSQPDERANVNHPAHHAVPDRLDADPVDVEDRSSPSSREHTVRAGREKSVLQGWIRGGLDGIEGTFSRAATGAYEVVQIVTGAEDVIELVRIDGACCPPCGRNDFTSP